QSRNHGVDLRLLGVPGADHRLLDQPRRIFADLETGARRGHDDDTARLAELERRLRIGVDENLLDRGAIGAMLGNQRVELISDRSQPLRQRRARIRLQLAVGDMRQSVTLSRDQTPAGGAEAGVETENFHARLASSSSGICSLPQTVWTSSSSSSASINRASCWACSLRTSTSVCGFQASLALSASPSIGSRALATSCRFSMLVQMRCPSSSLSTSSAPASTAASRTLSASAALAGYSIRPRRSNPWLTLPLAPRLPPFLEKAVRMFVAVRLR